MLSPWLSRVVTIKPHILSTWEFQGPSVVPIPVLNGLHAWCRSPRDWNRATGEIYEIFGNTYDIYIYINSKYLKVGTKDYERFESQRGWTFQISPQLCLEAACEVYDLEPELRHHYPEIDERNEQFLRALKRKAAGPRKGDWGPEPECIKDGFLIKHEDC